MSGSAHFFGHCALLTRLALARAARKRGDADALTMIREAIELYLESLDAHGDPLPAPIEIERVTVEA